MQERALAETPAASQSEIASGFRKPAAFPFFDPSRESRIGQKRPVAAIPAFDNVIMHGGRACL